MKNKEKEKRENYFISRCQFYQTLFQLLNYEIEYVISDSTNYCATFYIRQESRQANIKYMTPWLFNDETTYKDIDKTAFHEMYEMNLYNMTELIDNYYSRDFRDTKVHSQVRLMENILFPKVCDERWRIK